VRVCGWCLSWSTLESFKEKMGGIGVSPRNQVIKIKIRSQKSPPKNSSEFARHIRKNGNLSAILSHEALAKAEASASGAGGFD
jgi:hypothetical protein